MSSVCSADMNGFDGDGDGDWDGDGDGDGDGNGDGNVGMVRGGVPLSAGPFTLTRVRSKGRYLQRRNA